MFKLNSLVREMKYDYTEGKEIHRQALRKVILY
jgi:hypothetical protein